VHFRVISEAENQLDVIESLLWERFGDMWEGEPEEAAIRLWRYVGESQAPATLGMTRGLGTREIDTPCCFYDSTIPRRLSLACVTLSTLCQWWGGREGSYGAAVQQLCGAGGGLSVEVRGPDRAWGPSMATVWKTLARLRICGVVVLRGGACAYQGGEVMGGHRNGRRMRCTYYGPQEHDFSRSQCLETYPVHPVSFSSSSIMTCLILISALGHVACRGVWEGADGPSEPAAGGGAP
jgi:hypothetical protein